MKYLTIFVLFLSYCGLSRALGRCHGFGDMCAGFAGFRCCDGLQCKMEYQPYVSDAAGICVKSPSPSNYQIKRGCQGEAKMCGGIAAFRCCPGLRCFIKDNYPDASGKCIVDVNRLKSFRLIN